MACEFYVLMVKRADGNTYCDLHKTTGKIYATREDAEKGFGVNAGRKYYKVVKIIGMLGAEYDDLTHGRR